MVGLLKFIFVFLLAFILITLARVFIFLAKAVNMGKKHSGSTKKTKSNSAKKDESGKKVIELDENDYHVE